MAIVINAIITVILLYYAYKYASGGTMIIKHPFKVGEYYECNNNLSFMIFSVMTAMVFLGPLSLVKYAIWIFFMLLMLRRWVKKWDGVMTIYLIFILWNLYTLTYSHYIFQGWMMIVKFCLPILYFWMGYNAIEDSLDLWIFLKRTVLICVIYSFLIGGVSAKLISPLYGFLCFGTGGTFVAYASLADFYAILIGVPVMLYIFTSERKFLYAAGLLFLSSILESVRTGIGASILGLSLLFLAYKKGRAVPAVMLLIALFVGSVFFVKPVREKMFGKQAETVTISNVGKAKIETSGREYMWKRIMNHCYNPNPTFGSGCGGALGWLKDINSKGGLVLIHSDWVQMMSESGNIGLCLYILFAVFMLFKVLAITWRYRNNKMLTLLGGTTAGAFAACFFCMGFDNVITYAQQGYVLPFMLFGIFLKTIDLTENGEFEEEIIP